MMNKLLPRYAFLTADPDISYIDLYSSTTDVPSGWYLGAYQPGSQGSWYRYCKAGASALVVGNLLQSPTIGTNANDLAVPSTSLAVTTGAGLGAGQPVAITNANATVNASDFKGGLLEVSVTPDLGSVYTIVDNSAATTTGTLTLYLDRPIRTSWTTSTKVTLSYNPWNGVIQSPTTTLTGINVGFAVYAIPASSYGWIQTHGLGSALSDTTSIIMGSGVTGASTYTAGAITLHQAGYQVIATALRAAASAKTIPLYETID